MMCTSKLKKHYPYFLFCSPGSHMLLDFDVREQQEIEFFTDGSVIVNYGLT